MYRKILVPVDLADIDRLTKALRTAADLSRLYGAPITYVGLTGTAPDTAAHTPEEYRRRLEAFVADQAATHGIHASAHAIVSHDPAAELDSLLREAVVTLGADLVVMASHEPGLLDWLWPSHGGSVAEHAKVSVFVVR